MFAWFLPSKPRFHHRDAPEIGHAAILYTPLDASDLAQIKEIEKASARLEIRVTPVGRRTIGENEMALEYAQWEEWAGLKAVTEDLITSSLERCPPRNDAEHKR